jgi:hypothetical protein
MPEDRGRMMVDAAPFGGDSAAEIGQRLISVAAGVTLET